MPYPLTTACSTLSPRPVVQRVYLQSIKAWLSLGGDYLQVCHQVCQLCAQCVVLMVMHGGGMVAITYIFAIIIVRVARYVLHDAQRRRRRVGVRHRPRRRRRRGGDSVRTYRALRREAVRTGRSISLTTLIYAATLNI